MADKMKLTTGVVTRLTACAVQIVVWDTQMPGLGVRVSPAGTKTYFYQRRVKGESGGKERNVSLGRHGDPVLAPDGVSARSFPFGPEDARIKAAAVQAQLLAGVDPVVERERRKAEAAAKADKDAALSTTLRETLANYLEHRRVKGRPLRPATKFNLKQEIEKHFAEWLDRPVAGITRDMCMTQITKVEAGYPKQVARIAAYLSSLLNHARELHATDEGYPILAVNPVTRMKKIKQLQKPKARSTSLPVSKVGAAWLALRRRAANPVRAMDRTQADWVCVVILTGCREGESAALQWNWFDWETKTFTIPGDLHVVTDNPRLFVGTKTHVPLTVPMSDALYDILKARFDDEERHPVYVFPAGRSDSEIPYVNTARGPLKEIEEATGVHVGLHDLRRTTVRVAIECRVDYALRQRLLNHASASVHDDYERDTDPETMRPTMNTLATFIVDASKVAEAQQSGANVISLADRKRDVQAQA
jgi:integrase